MAAASNSGFWGRTTRTSRGRKKPFTSPLRFETLEERHMMSVSPMTPFEAIRPSNVSADAYETDNTATQAKTISTDGQTQTHSVHAKGDADYVKFSLAAAGNVIIETGGSAGDTELRLYNGAGTQIAYNNDYNRRFSRISVSNLAAGTYYARVNEYGNNATIASYTVKVTSATGGSSGDAYEVDNSMSQAKTITLNAAAQTHSIHTAGDQDWVKLTLGATTSVVVATSGSAGDTELTLYNASGSQIAYNNNYGSSYFSQISTTLAAGSYYARVNEYGNNATIASYTLQVTGSASSTTNYMLVTAWGGTWTDADKSTTNTEDDLMCWAATTANMLQWTGWGNAGGMTTADAVFTYFQNHWTDQGGHQYYGGDWWFDGTNPMQGASGWSQVDVVGGGFFPSQNYYSYVHLSTDAAQTMSTINSYLHSGYAVGLGLQGPGGHAVTCWGYEHAAGNPSSYKGVYITDSDDNQSTPGSNYLKYYTVVQSNGLWYLQNFYGSNSWYLSDVTGLDRRPSAAGVPTLTASARLVLSRYREAATADAFAPSALSQSAFVEQPTFDAQIPSLSDAARSNVAQPVERLADSRPQPVDPASRREQQTDEVLEPLEDPRSAVLHPILSDAVAPAYI